MKYGDFTALRGINLDVQENSTCAIIGPSGCGKSTLLYGLAGILRPFGGKISIHGAEVVENRRKTGLILQNYGLLPWKTVWENAALGLKIRKASAKAIAKDVTSILNKLDIYDLRDKYPVQLSGGQMQRVAIARTLTIQPDLLLMDEPFSSLDAISRESLQNLLLKIFKDNNLTVVIVTHNIEEAVFLGQKIIIMDKSEGRIRHILENPHFGDDSLRYKNDFYKMCTDVRLLMEGDNRV